MDNPNSTGTDTVGSFFKGVLEKMTEDDTTTLDLEMELGGMTVDMRIEVLNVSRTTPTPPSPQSHGV